jgi:di/tricarboxylate transporter
VTFQIALVLTILGLAVILFVSERLRVDIVALLVLISLALAGLVTPEEALGGFSSPAVVTVWAVFILSAGLYRTGIAGLIGRHILRLAGESESGLLITIMTTAGLMSAFMNNVGVAALLLPVVMDITRRTGHPPSRLLMPLAFGSLLGGLTTQIGTPPNILISNSMAEFGLEPFALFDYTPVGLSVMIAGIAFMAVFGKRLLPIRNMSREFTENRQIDYEQVYDFSERLFVLRVPTKAGLAGKTLAESKLGTLLGVNILGIIRNGETQLSPNPATLLKPGDRLLAAGRPDTLANLHEQGSVEVEEERVNVERLVSTEIELAELGLSSNSDLVGQTLQQVDFRGKFGVNVLAILRKGKVTRTNLQNIPLQRADTLIIQGPRTQIDLLREIEEFLVSSVEVAEVSSLHERLMVVKIPSDSNLVGRTLGESRLGEVFGLTVLGIVRNGSTQLMPKVGERLMAEDTLLVEGKVEDLMLLRGLQTLELEREAAISLKDLESEKVGLAEAVLSPHTNLVGKTLRDIHFREKYGLSVLAIWREGRAYRSSLKDIPLKFGDALLLFGNREKIKVLGSDPDFLVLMEEAEEAPRTDKAPVALAIMGIVIIPVIFNLLPIYLAAIIGATMMVLTKCLTMEEAYRHIEWRAVFLIAGMLPLGLALERTGTASLVADSLISVIGGLSPLVLLGGIFMLTAIAAQVMPTSAVAVLMAPIAIRTALTMGISPHALLMAVAMSASASFMSPVAHPANVLIMGPGGYRFIDYIKVGLPLTLAILFVVILVLPVFWPVHP